MIGERNKETNATDHFARTLILLHSSSFYGPWEISSETSKNLDVHLLADNLRQLLFKCVNSERDLFYVDNTRQVRGCCQGTLSEEVR